jgi:hypothetical protein
MANDIKHRAMFPGGVSCSFSALIQLRYMQEEESLGPANIGSFEADQTFPDPFLPGLGI